PLNSCARLVDGRVACWDNAEYAALGALLEANVAPPKAAGNGYEPSVRQGHTAPLNAARVPFATYLTSMHNRIHPIFADQLLSTLARLPGSHPLNQDLSTDVEIVIDKDTGRLARSGVVKTSGVTEFDAIALSVVSRAAPFGKAPDVIASPDGNVYVHWEFHR